MTSSSGNRDDELELIRQLLIATARRTETTDTKVDRLVESQDRTQRQLDQLSVTVDNLATMMERFIENAEADRAVVRGVQTENRRILDYLFGQQDDPPQA